MSIDPEIRNGLIAFAIGSLLYFSAIILIDVAQKHGWL
jgi:hypothetical protein